MSTPIPSVSDETVRELASSLHAAPAERILEAAFELLGDDVPIASSFGAEDVVLIEMASSLRPGVRVFTLDTGRLPPETYDVMERVRERYDIRLDVWMPDPAEVRDLVAESGLFSFYSSIEARKACCRIRKLGPLGRALSGASGWVTGVRREQTESRAVMEVVERDGLHGGIVKFNPLATWSREEVWERIRARRIPYNVLHDRGYPSLGCAPCTRAVEEGQPERAGRWWWENSNQRECGLHAR